MNGSPQQPVNTTSVALLFNQSVMWSDVAGPNAGELPAQLFSFMPTIVGTALNISADKVITYGLAAYHGNGEVDSTNWRSQTTYEAYVPKDLVQNLQDAVNQVDSKLYTGQAKGVNTQLASYVVTGFNVLSGAGNTKSAQLNASGTGGQHNNTLRDALIGVFVPLVVLLAAALVFVLLWRKKKDAQAAALAREKRDKDEPVWGTSMMQRQATIRSVGLRETWDPNAMDHEGGAPPVPNGGPVTAGAIGRPVSERTHSAHSGQPTPDGSGSGSSSNSASMNRSSPSGQMQENPFAEHTAVVTAGQSVRSQRASVATGTTGATWSGESSSATEHLVLPRAPGLATIPSSPAMSQSQYTVSDAASVMTESQRIQAAYQAHETGTALSPGQPGADPFADPQRSPRREATQLQYGAYNANPFYSTAS